MLTRSPTAQFRKYINKLNLRSTLSNTFIETHKTRNKLRLRKQSSTTKIVEVTTLEENDLVRRLVIIVLVTLAVQTIAILWNCFAVWDASEPDKWHNDFETTMSKSIISVTCLIITFLVVWIRILDRKQLCGKGGDSYVIFYEALIQLCHIPPFSLGFFSPRDDAWNIIGTLKLYLLSELVKINHPLWKKRYDINAARIEAHRQPYLIGSFFCLTESLSQLHPFFVFLCIVLVFVGMFIV